MTHRDKEQARALEYARSQGWTPPEIGGQGFTGSRKDLSLRIGALERGQQVTVDALEAANVALAAERASHAVTKRAVLRGTKARCVALEALARELLVLEMAAHAEESDDPDERDQARVAREGILSQARDLLK